MKNKKTIITSFVLMALFFTLSGCLPSEPILKNEAEKAAQGFAIAWQHENYGKIYDLLIPELQELKSKEDFIEFVKYSQAENKFYFIYEKVVLQSKDEAYAYYSFSGESPVIQPKAPAVRMKYVRGDWRFDTLAGYLTSFCIVDNCYQYMRKLWLNEASSRCIRSYWGYDDCLRSYERDFDKIQWECNKSTNYVCKKIEWQPEHYKEPQEEVTLTSEKITTIPPPRKKFEGITTKLEDIKDSDVRKEVNSMIVSFSIIIESNGTFFGEVPLEISCYDKNNTEMGKINFYSSAIVKKQTKIKKALRMYDVENAQKRVLNYCNATIVE